MPKLFDIMDRMSAENKDIRFAPLAHNFVRAKYGKGGTEITIGVDGNVVGGLLTGQFVGGLILMDKGQFEETQKKLTEEERAGGKT